MSYTDKMARAEAILTEHFSKVEDASYKKDVPTILHKLKEMGATTEDALAECTWEDLVACDVPRLKAKEIASIFRQKPKTQSDHVSAKTADRMSYEELLGRYKPEEDNAVSAKLKSLSGGLRFIVFNIDGNVDVTSSTKLLTEIKKGFGERPDAIFSEHGETKRIYAVGEVPAQSVDLNPLYKDRPLRPGEVCDQTGRSWEGIDLHLRQLVHIAAYQTQELQITREKAHDILDVLTTNPNPEAYLRSRYPKASLVFNESQTQDTLPKLKGIFRPRNTGSGKNPFQVEATKA
jgi:hypothetical protein